jgi:hypothetical protein
MQSDAERRKLASALHRVVCGCRTDHEARRRENTITMGAFDGLVQWDGEAEIIGRHDEPLCP